ncbi:MAG: HlyD family secretion protein, partial [Saprospiraceae bacterium]|nr:HlyD family secretion protein [Saprospiraceae bacterium]
DVYTHIAENALSVPIIAVTALEDEKDKAAKKDEEADKRAESDKKPIGTDIIKEVVFVVTGDTVAVREVKTGIQDNNHIEILSGLQENEQIVTGPYSAIARKLKSGARITIVDKKKLIGKSSKED